MSALQAICFLTLSIFLSTAGAAGIFYSGNDLKEKLEASAAHSQGVGLGFIVGVADSVSGTWYCAPSGAGGIQAGQLQEVVRKYFLDNPDKLNLNAESLVTIALARAWPCAKKQVDVPPRPPKPKPKPEDKSPF